MLTGIENVEQTCKVCGYFCKNRRSLGNHLAKSHSELGTSKDYFDNYLKTSDILCACGCGEKTAWQKVEYRYGDYINGHNPAGFKVKQPVFTPAQIKKRNKKIKEAYASQDLRDRIGQSVKEGLDKSNHDPSEHFISQWQDPDFQEKQRISRIESWQGEKGKIRKEKVFTKEFGRKISEANMKREVRRTSQAEEDFCCLLESMGERVIRSRWFNFPDKIWCADCYLPDSKTIIEFDGSYWHGRDRSSEFSVRQLVSMTNDLKKNKIARDRKLNLIRVCEPDVASIKTLDDLMSVATHIVSQGEVIREGTRRHADSDVIVSRETLIKLTQEKGREEVEKTYLKSLKDYLRAYVAYWGWFYPERDEDLAHVLSKLKNCDKLNQSTTGSPWLKKRVKSYWNVDGGPMKSFNDDKSLESVLKYRLGLNNSKDYTYKLSNGTIYTGRETFDITLAEVRAGFIVQRMKVSWFKPAWAAYIYKKYLANCKNPTVWDPSVGFSARMLGFASTYPTGTYIGCEPASETFSNSQYVANEITHLLPQIKIDVKQQGSEIFDLSANSVDLVFTCPPYFDTEKYFNEPGQCWRDYPDKKTWIDRYLIPTLVSARIALKAGCYAVFVISTRLSDDLIHAGLAAGLEFVKCEEFVMSNDHFERSNSSERVQKECVVVFSKLYLRNMHRDYVKNIVNDIHVNDFVNGKSLNSFDYEKFISSLSTVRKISNKLMKRNKSKLNKDSQNYLFDNLDKIVQYLNDTFSKLIGSVDNIEQFLIITNEEKSDKLIKAFEKSKKDRRLEFYFLITSMQIIMQLLINPFIVGETIFIVVPYNFVRDDEADLYRIIRSMTGLKQIQVNKTIIGNFKLRIRGIEDNSRSRPHAFAVSDQNIASFVKKPEYNCYIICRHTVSKSDNFVYKSNNYVVDIDHDYIDVESIMIYDPNQTEEIEPESA